MGSHIDLRKSANGKKKRFTTESQDFTSRQQRVTFKMYVRGLEEELLEDDLDNLEDDLDDSEEPQ